MKCSFLSMTALSLLLGTYGCGSPEQSEPATPTAPVADGRHEGHSDHDHTDADPSMSDMEKMKSELAKLSPEDAASAEKQHFCPVSGEMLGTMGAPIKVDVNGQDVWICCEGCRKQLLESPEEHLAKLHRE